MKQKERLIAEAMYNFVEGRYGTNNPHYQTKDGNEFVCWEWAWQPSKDAGQCIEVQKHFKIGVVYDNEMNEWYAVNLITMHRFYNKDILTAVVNATVEYINQTNK